VWTGAPLLVLRLRAQEHGLSKRAVEASNYKDTSGSAMEILSFRQAFAIKFSKTTNDMLDAEDSYPDVHPD